MLTLNIFRTLLSCFCCRRWTSKCWLEWNIILENSFDRAPESLSTQNSFPLTKREMSSVSFLWRITPVCLPGAGPVRSGIIHSRPVLQPHRKQSIYLLVRSAVFYIMRMLVFSLFHVAGLFLYPRKTSENLWFSGFFRGYRKIPVAWNGFILLEIFFNFAAINRWIVAVIVECAVFLKLLSKIELYFISWQINGW